MINHSSSNSSFSSLNLDSSGLDPTASSLRQNNHRSWTIALFSVTTLLLFADQNLMSPNLTEIAEEFGFDDDERDRKLGGDISLAFFLLGAPASMAIGCLADSSDRSVVFAWTVFIGEGACLATYWVQTYGQLYICRAITGFSVGGAVPLIYSILGDLYAAEDRHMVSSLVSFGTGAGIAVGQAIAGFLGPVYGWRLPFLVVAVPALLTALAVLFLVPDPERGAMEGRSMHLAGPEELLNDIALSPMPRKSRHKDYSPLSSSQSPAVESRKMTSRVVQEINMDNIYEEYYLPFGGQEMKTQMRNMANILSTPTVLLAVLQGAPGCIPWGIINVFLNDFLSEDRGFSVQRATATLMFFSIGHAFGLFLVGGAMARTLYQSDKRYPALLAGGTAIGGCIPLWILLNKVDVSTPYFLVILIASLAGFGSGPTGPIIKATLTNVTHPRARGQAFAFFNLFDDFGKGLGPFFVSIIISRMGGRLPAFNVGVLGWVICGVANLAIYFFVERDEATVQAAIIRSRMASRSLPYSTP